MSIADNVKRVQDTIAMAAQKSGKADQDIVLVAATKMNTAERVREAIEAGIRVAGENRVQELLEKNNLHAYEGAELHFIGSLQKNKVRHITGLCDLIQSVDSPDLIDEIDKRACSKGIRQKILIEVNIGKELAKSGVQPEELERLLAYSSLKSGISVIGLMTIPPIARFRGENHHYFDAMYKLFVDIRAKKYDNVVMKYLSMGMSDDFSDAISAGANMVRVGSAIFGSRKYESDLI